MFKVSNRNNRTRFEICSKLTIKTPERNQLRRSGLFIVNFEHISHLLLVFLLLTLNRLMLTGTAIRGVLSKGYFTQDKCAIFDVLRFEKYTRKSITINLPAVTSSIKGHLFCCFFNIQEETNSAGELIVTLRLEKTRRCYQCLKTLYLAM